MISIKNYKVVLTLLSVIVLSLSSCKKGEETSKVDSSDKQIISEDIPQGYVVSDWLQSFSTGDFDTCDTYTSDESFKFSDFSKSTESETSLISAEVYQQLLKQSIKSIKGITVDSISESGELNLSITYSPFKTVSTITFDDTKLTEISDLYTIKDCTATEYKEALTDWVLTSFDGAFELSSDEKVLSVTLEQCVEHDETLVSNVEDFILPLLDAQGIIEIVETFEHDLYLKLSGFVSEYSL